jgi:hypothetical protein
MPPAPPAECVILVPVGGAVDAGCEEGLRELERRGYSPRRAAASTTPILAPA